MELSQQVVSLELSKKLKELGVKKESLFYYQNNPYNDGQDCIDLMIKERRSKNSENTIMNTECNNDKNPKYSAFTASELLEILPEDIDSHYLKIQKLSVYPEKIITYFIEYGYGKLESNDTNLSSALAKMIIQLITNKLIEV